MNRIELLAEFRHVAEQILQLQSQLQDLEMQVSMSSNCEKGGWGI